MEWNNYNLTNNPAKLEDFDPSKVYVVWGDGGWLAASYDRENHEWVNDKHTLPKNITHWAEVTPPIPEKSQQQIVKYYIERATKLSDGESLQIPPEHDSYFRAIESGIGKHFAKPENGEKSTSSDPKTLTISIHDS